MNQELCVYVDVDDTLVRSVSGKRIPIPAAIRHVAELHRQGTKLYCWSSGGADYAQRSAEELGLAHCFVAFLPKPHVIIDDQHIVEWPHFLHVHPAAVRDLEDYRTQLGKSVNILNLDGTSICSDTHEDDADC